MEDRDSGLGECHWAAAKPRQYTRGDKSATAPEWSPDGTMLAFLSDREKDGERQVWMMMADGGEAWAVTSHKGGVSGFRFSPDGKQLVLTATDQPTKDEEDRKKVKDDTMVIDHDIRMTHLWTLEHRKERREAAHRRRLHGQRSAMVARRYAHHLHHATHAKSGRWQPERCLGGDRCQRRKEEDWRRRRIERQRALVAGREVDRLHRQSRSRAVVVDVTYLYLVSAAGGTPKQLTTKFDLSVGTPVWSRDGRTIYFSANVLEANEVYSAMWRPARSNNSRNAAARPASLKSVATERRLSARLRHPSIRPKSTSHDADFKSH